MAKRVGMGPLVLPETKKTLGELSETLDLSLGQVIDLLLERYKSGGSTPPSASGEALELEQSAWVKSTLKRLQGEYSVGERDALDMVFAFFESMGGECPGCSGRLAGIGEVQEAAVVPEPDGPEMTCVHGGEVFRIPVGARFTDICPDCIGTGHQGDVRDCPACGEGRSA